MYDGEKFTSKMFGGGDDQNNRYIPLPGALLQRHHFRHHHRRHWMSLFDCLGSPLPCLHHLLRHPLPGLHHLLLHPHSRKESMDDNLD